MRKISKIIVHCSATKPSQECNANIITQWHVARGFKTIGYHFVILRDGKIEKGRPISQVGAHCKGHNSDSIGICLIGGLNNDMSPSSDYTIAQKQVLHCLIKLLSVQYSIPYTEIYGHRDLDPHKTCPNFNVQKFYNYGLYSY